VPASAGPHQDREETPFQDLAERHPAASVLAGEALLVTNVPHNRGARPGGAGHNRRHGVFPMADG